MRRLILALAALSLGGCSTLSALAGAAGTTSHQETMEALGEHLEGCDRHYQGNLGLGASFTFNIDCKAQPAPEN